MLTPSELERLGEVISDHARGVFQIGDGPRHAKDAIERARRQSQTLSGAGQEALSGRVQFACSTEHSRSEPCIQRDASRRSPRVLPGARVLHPCANGGGGLAGRVRRQVGGRQRRDVDREIHAIAQRT